jgi:hypothetical protein
MSPHVYINKAFNRRLIESIFYVVWEKTNVFRARTTGLRDGLPIWKQTALFEFESQYRTNGDNHPRGVEKFGEFPRAIQATGFCGLSRLNLQILDKDSLSFHSQ